LEIVTKYAQPLSYSHHIPNGIDIDAYQLLDLKQSSTPWPPKGKSFNVRGADSKDSRKGGDSTI